MSYQKFSQTTSGWEISNDSQAAPEKQWRIQHPEWGTRYYSTYEDASRSALTEGVERLSAAFKALYG